MRATSCARERLRSVRSRATAVPQRCAAGSGVPSAAMKFLLINRYTYAVPTAGVAGRTAAGTANRPELSEVNTLEGREQQRYLPAWVLMCGVIPGGTHADDPSDTCNESGRMASAI